jgi:hypothetical protein
VNMKINFYGHAATLVCDSENRPLIATDPWLLGSCYWRSWWLENPPPPAEIDKFKLAKFIYITHEHPDHFHFPSIRAIGKGPIYLFADQAHKTNLNFLSSHGFKTRELPAYEWVDIDPAVKIMSIPNWNDDSALLILTPDAVVINLNDSRFSKITLRKISRLLDKWPVSRLLCQSYSPASFIFNFFRGKDRLIVVKKQRYVDSVFNACKLLRADAFAPFASQNIFMRSDTYWANSYKVTYSDLQNSWSLPTKLIPCYASIFLNKKLPFSQIKFSFAPDSSEEKVALAENYSQSPISDSLEVCKLLKDKFRVFSLFLMIFFPRGVKFSLDSGQNYVYKPFSFEAKTISKQAEADLTFFTSSQPFYEALKYNNFNDLSISMFTKINVKRPKIDPLLVYILFILLELSDHGHFNSFSRFMKFLATNVPRFLNAQFKIS